MPYEFNKDLMSWSFFDSWMDNRGIRFRVYDAESNQVFEVSEDHLIRLIKLDQSDQSFKEAYAAGVPLADIFA